MPNLDADQIARRRKLFEALGNQSVMGQPTQMVSGRAVPQGLGVGLTRLAQAYMASKGLKSADEASQTGTTAATQRVIDAMSGSPQTGGPMRPDLMKGDYQPVQPAVEPDYLKAATIASTDPYLQENKALQGVTQAMLKGGQQGSTSPYYTTFVGQDGKAYKFNSRTGDIEPLGVVSGKLDPVTQENISGAKETGKLTAKGKLEPKVEADILSAKQKVLLKTKPEIEAETVREKTKAGYEEANRQRAESMPALISTARDILETGSPTESGMGTAWDYAASLFGFSPEGASAADQLKAIGGALTSKMPRMEGPQSDKDTLLYREMAGRIGDATLPTERRLAALKIVEAMWAKPPGTPYSEVSGKDKKDSSQSIPEGVEPKGDMMPEGIDPELWKYMTDEEKALWQQ